jgi:hypothetical protein
MTGRLTFVPPVLVQFLGTLVVGLTKISKGLQRR